VGSEWEGIAGGGGGGGKQASDVGMVGWPIPDLGCGHGVGHIYLSSLSMQAIMAQLSTARYICGPESNSCIL